MFGGLSLHVCVLLEIIYQQKKNYFSVAYKTGLSSRKNLSISKTKRYWQYLWISKDDVHWALHAKTWMILKTDHYHSMSLVHCQKWASYANV